jgi:CubicO group peptidase (beta-lactamase class C family)
VLQLPLWTVPAPLRAADSMNARAVDAPGPPSEVDVNVPGAALALIKDGRVVLEKGYGFRDLETHAPVSEGTLFNIGSIFRRSGFFSLTRARAHA